MFCSPCFSFSAARRWRLLPLIGVAMLAVNFHGSSVMAEEPLRLEGKAPPGQAIVGHLRGGAFFVDKELKRRHDDLLAQSRELQFAVKSDATNAADAQEQLRFLEGELDGLRGEIEAKKVFVPAATTQTETEEAEFELGAERLLVITADRVNVRGWDQPRVTVVLKKFVLAADAEPAIDELDALRVVHRQAAAPELVGKTPEQYAAEEEAFLASDAGRALSEDQRASRRALVKEIHDDYAPYRDFQGKPLDVLDIEGLTYEQGNRNVSTAVQSAGGESRFSFEWRRDAELTVFVPPCRGLLLRGCGAGLDIEDVHAPIILTDSDSRNNDYDGSFRIRGVEGPLRIDNVPLNHLENVHGDVAIIATLDHTGSTTGVKGGLRASYIAPPRECVIRDVEGDLSAWFSRVSLKVGKVTGRIDVKNEAGDTTLTVAEQLASVAHRVVSDCGQIEVHLGAAALGGLPVMALTNLGSVRNNRDREVLDDTSFTSGSSNDGSRRAWQGFKSKRDFKPAALPDEARRPAAVLANEPRSPGLDLISRSGTVVLMIEPKEAVPLGKKAD